MIDWSGTPRTPSWDKVGLETFSGDIQVRGRPAVLRGLVQHWPAVVRGRQSAESLCTYLRGFAGDRSVDAFFGPAGIKGRFFYDDTFTRLNFERRKVPFSHLLELLIRACDAAEPPSFYAGAVRIKETTPGFLADNPSPLLDPNVDQLNSLWVGNRTRIACHWDLPQNLICVVGGRRRYTLFPPEQLPNLYPGPIDLTPAGQPISLVDFHAPDLGAYPRFAEAARSAEIAELEPGDALYLPSMWWHHAESLDPVGVMVNYWWRDAAMHMTTPFTTLLHALLTLRDLPENERQAWRVFFDYYIFGTGGQPLAHLPVQARGVLGEMTPEMAVRLRAQIARTLQW